MKKILLIEDEIMLSDMYKDKFAEAGLDVVWAMEAEEGIELAKKEKPDLIVLDILLPRDNGIEFLEKKNKIPEIASIPVVVFSNFDDPDTKKKAAVLGIKEYIIKTNFTPEGVVRKIKGYLK